MWWWVERTQRWRQNKRLHQKTEENLKRKETEEIETRSKPLLDAPFSCPYIVIEVIWSSELSGIVGNYLPPLKCKNYFEGQQTGQDRLLSTPSTLWCWTVDFHWTTETFQSYLKIYFIASFLSAWGIDLGLGEEVSPIYLSVQESDLLWKKSCNI